MLAILNWFSHPISFRAFFPLLSPSPFSCSPTSTPNLRGKIAENQNAEVKIVEIQNAEVKIVEIQNVKFI
jgi:hypothetical protein